MKIKRNIVKDNFPGHKDGKDEDGRFVIYDDDPDKKYYYDGSGKLIRVKNHENIKEQ